MQNIDSCQDNSLLSFLFLHALEACFIINSLGKVMDPLCDVNYIYFVSLEFGSFEVFLM